MMTEEQVRQAPAEQYMDAEQQAFFRARLLSLKTDTQAHIETIKQQLADPPECNDAADRAQMEDETALNLRIVDRERRLLHKIEQALRRLQTGDYGYCLETGDPIGIERLLIRPTAEYGTDVKTLSEHRETFYAD